MSQESKANSALKVRELNRIMSSLNRRLTYEIRDAVVTPSPGAGFWARKIAKVESVYSLMVREFRIFAEDQFESLAEKASEGIDKIMAAAGLGRKAALTSNVSSMIAESVTKFATGADEGLQRTRTLFRVTQQNLIEENRITQMIRDGQFEGEPPKTIARTLQKELTESLYEKGQTLTINGRNYDPEYYSEMVARTRGREIQTEASLNTIREFGVDLVRVSSHNTESEICKEYEGNTYSLSGRAEGYEQLTEFPPFHPSCRHVITPVIE